VIVGQMCWSLSKVDLVELLSHFLVAITAVGSSCFFFFSSRRRHTRFSRDWSSDVCSSDLMPSSLPPAPRHPGPPAPHHPPVGARSEERRVGKECRSRCSPNQVKKHSN